jgi:dephospho-CoA kinase
MIIGITGGIGSGKSVISKELRRMGYEVYDTDSEAKRLIVENVQIRRNIEDLLGKEVYKDNVYQTQIVASKVFANKSLLVQLNAIVHPAVREDILSRTQDFINNTTSLYFIECAILYTAHLDDICDKVVAITAPEAIRLERTIARDSSDKNKVRARMRMQDVEHDIQRADIIINNDGSTPVPTLCKELLELATKIEHL